jgi:hypothetical protein
MGETRFYARWPDSRGPSSYIHSSSTRQMWRLPALALTQNRCEAGHAFSGLKIGVQLTSTDIKNL